MLGEITIVKNLTAAIMKIRKTWKPWKSCFQISFRVWHFMVFDFCSKEVDCVVLFGFASQLQFSLSRSSCFMDCLQTFCFAKPWYVMRQFNIVKLDWVKPRIVHKKVCFNAYSNSICSTTFSGLSCYFDKRFCESSNFVKLLWKSKLTK